MSVNAETDRLELGARAQEFLAGEARFGTEWIAAFGEYKGVGQ